MRGNAGENKSKRLKLSICVSSDVCTYASKKNWEGIPNKKNQYGSTYASALAMTYALAWRLSQVSDEIFFTTSSIDLLFDSEKKVDTSDSRSLHGPSQSLFCHSSPVPWSQSHVRAGKSIWSSIRFKWGSEGDEALWMASHIANQSFDDDSIQALHFESDSNMLWSASFISLWLI